MADLTSQGVEACKRLQRQERRDLKCEEGLDDYALTGCKNPSRDDFKEWNSWERSVIAKSSQHINTDCEVK